MSARKVYAVPREELDRRNERANGSNSTSQVDEQRQQQLHMDLTSKISGMELNIQNGIERSTQQLQESISTIRLVGPLKDALRCLYCRGTSRPPVIYGLCCGQVIGCGECHLHYDGETCIHCRSNEFSTIQLRFFDALLEIMHQLNM